MKKISFCFLLCFLFCLFSYAFAQDENVVVSTSAQTMSNVDEQQQNSNNETNNNEQTYTESGAIVNTAEEESLYELNIPTTTALGISGQKALDRFGIKQSSQTVSTSSNTTNTSETNSVNTSSNTAKDNKKNESKSKEKDKDSEDKNFLDTILPSKVLAKLPFESQLLLSGRKLIGVKYEGTVYDKEESGKRTNSASFSMEQELQMKIKGKVGERLELNVDFDDTQEDKKDISIVYKGKPEEFVQEAAFGDISVNLPSTEFSGYSKELFGAKINTKYKGLKTDAFFSKTKGYSESKRFTGNSKTEKKIIPDTAYIKLKYYSILDTNNAAKTIKNGTAKVYLDKGRVTAADYIVISTTTDLKYLKENPKTTIYNGNFVKLIVGTDYTIDYTKGVISFRSGLAKNYVVAIDYQYTDGTWLSDSTNGNPQIIKDNNNTEALSTELFTYYSLGNYNITKYDGRNNFILEVRDLSDKIPSEIYGGKKVPKFPGSSNYDANIIVDYDNGIFNLQPVDGKPMHDDLYSSGTHRYNFVTQYEYKVKIFTLRTGIVSMSEKVSVDGKKLKINEDYMIDYDVGILTILKDDLIKENSVIDVSYDYSPFGGTTSGSTMLGFRTQYDFNDNISVGGSLIYEFENEETELPDIYSTPSSKLVGEVDAKIKNVNITDDLHFSANAEYAKSKYLKNVTGKAILESMEGAKQEDGLSLIDDYWFYSATPNSLNTKYNLNALTWRNYDVEKKSIDKNLEVIDGEKQQVMDLNYDLTSCDDVSIAQIVSVSGYDFSEKLYLEIWIKANFSKIKIQLDYASNINEDSDRSGILDTEDKNEDGMLSPWEDIGRDFVNRDYAYGTSKIGANNGILDTEDINRNNMLDTYEYNMTSFVLNDKADLSKNDSWQKIQIPLEITDKEKWKNIRVARLTISNNSGTNKGTLTIGKISVVGNKWTADIPDTTSSLSTFGISSIGRDDPNYESLLNNSDYRSLYDIDSSTKRDEQSLRLNYDSNSSNDEFYAKTTYTASMDISDYEKFRFFVYVASSTATSGSTNFIMRVGGDEDDYFQYSVPITDDFKGKWTLITIKQEASGATGKWVCEEHNASIEVVGTPTLKHISFIKTGIKTSEADTGEIWVNEIHVKDTKAKEGSAWKTDLNLRWDGNGTVGAIDINVHRKSIDLDFETFAPGTYDREYLEDLATVRFDGVNISGTKLLPINASIQKTRVVTPAALDNTSDTVSILDEGKVVTYTGRVQTVVSGGEELPKLTLEYTKKLQDIQNEKQLEDIDRVDANLVYKNPIDFDVLPKNITADYIVSNSAYKVYPTNPIKDNNTFLDLDTMRKYMDIKDFLTLEKTQTVALKAPFKFFDKVSFVPGYVLTRVNEKNKEYFENEEIFYEKSLKQGIGANLNLDIVKWFQPSIVYNINNDETYDLNYSTQTSNILYPGQTKTIDRMAITDITWNLQARDIAKSKYLNSLTFTTSYRFQDTDSYEGIGKDVSSIGFAMNKIWIRDNLIKPITNSSTSSYTVKKVLKRDDKRIIGRYSPFEAFDLKGGWLPLKTMNMSFTFTEGFEEAYTTGTQKNSYTKIWPDIIIGMTRFEKIFNTKWMSDTQLNLKHTKQTNTIYGVSYGDSIMYGADYRFKLLKKYDLLLEGKVVSLEEHDTQENIVVKTGENVNWAIQTATDIKQWRMNLRYENMQFWERNSKGELSSQILSNKIIYQVTSDLLFPTGIRLPIIGVIPLKNRIIFDSNVFYSTQSSDVNVEENNLQNFGLDVSVDYEISKNFRCTLEAGFSRFLYTFVPDENYTLLDLAAKVTIQF